MFDKRTHFKQVCQLVLSLIVGADWCNLVQFGGTWCSLEQLGEFGEPWWSLVQIGAFWCRLVQLGMV